MSGTLRVVVADDEFAARAKLVRLLGAHGDVRIVAETATGRQTADAIIADKPDLVFLDIRMPQLNGFEALAAAGAETPASPKVIFVTAFDEYAVQAFEVRALDYLLKPYDGARLAAALERVRVQTDLEHRPTQASLHGMLEAKSEEPAVAEIELTTRPYVERLIIRSYGNIRVVLVSEIDWVEAYGNYVRVHAGGQRLLARETMKRLETMLDPSLFCRVHRGAIVNLTRVREITSSGAGDALVRLDSGVRLRLSRSFRADAERRVAALVT